MNNDDDFTFCQVGGFNNKDDPEQNNLEKDIGGITIGDKLTSKTNNSSTDSLWGDKSPNNASTKQETVGSLSFTVTNISSSQESSEPLAQSNSKNAGNSVSNAKEKKAAGSKPAPRAKVPFEKGYSQMDWLKLTRTHPDLAGLKGQSNTRLISPQEVKQHKTEDSMWTVLKGRVYNITPYMKFHPGGVDMLMKAVGKDCTALFNKYHAWVNDEFLLEKCLVGILDDSK